MVTILHPVNINPNWDNLRREIQATYPGATITDYPRLAPQISEIVVTHDAVTAQGLEAILTAHNPATLTTEQAQVIVQANAKTQAAAIPNWAGWSEAQVLTWFDTNITNALPAANLAAANVVLGNMATAQRAMARMIVALRNAQYPDLQSD